MTQRPASKDHYLVTVLSLSFVLGMAIAVGVYAAWRSGVIAPGFPNVLSALSLLVCPSFILSFAVGTGMDSGFAVVLIATTIVLANGFLYAGTAAVGYFLVSIMMKKRRS